MNQNSEMPEQPRTLSRREFVRLLGAAAAGTGLVAACFRGMNLTPAQRAEAAEAITDRLGKLPLRNFGTRLGKLQVAPMMICQDWPAEFMLPSVQLGMNYVHKAGYWGALPEPFKKLDRESYITDITVDSTPNNPDDEEKAYQQVVMSLQRSGLGYFDIMRAHFGWKSVAEMKEKRGTYRAFERLKKEGKVRYFGASQHDWVHYPEIVAAEIEDGVIDALQVFHSFGATPADVEILGKAAAAGIGVSAMKVWSRGGALMQKDLERQKALKAEGKPGRALMRHVLTATDPKGTVYISGIVSNVRNFEQFEENVGAVATAACAADGFVFKP